MHRKEKFREFLKNPNAKVMNGTFILSGEPAIVEILGYAGYDFVFIDTEHALNDAHNLPELIRAADSAGIIPFVRVAENTPSRILRALDIGAAGILVPHVNTAEEAAAAVKAAKYFPHGERGLAGVVRAARYGYSSLDEYMKAQNDFTAVIVQIEDVAALPNVEAILAVPGVSGILVGPADLSQSMGIPGQFSDPEFRAAVTKVIQTASRLNKIASTFSFDAKDAQHWRSVGVNLLSVSADTILFAKAARNLLNELQ